MLRPRTELPDYINPYRSRIAHFPGRLFTFDDFAADQAALAALVKGRRCVCELGSGSGKHLIELARRHPEVLFFGFELRYKRAVRTIEKAEASGVENVYVLRVDARVADRLFEPHSLDALYVNFPDPWEKRREQKHRLLGPRLRDQAAALLVPPGVLSIKTDHESYFRGFLAEIENDKRFAIQAESLDLRTSIWVNDNIETEFECLFRAQGLRICHLRAQLRPR